uniref:Uncharacterized protein n=1 Tax=Oryza brachyantha TaxID=4533 RepID=J3LQZ8_ORYBR
INGSTKKACSIWLCHVSFMEHLNIYVGLEMVIKAIRNNHQYPVQLMDICDIIS